MAVAVNNVVVVAVVIAAVVLVSAFEVAAAAAVVVDVAEVAADGGATAVVCGIGTIDFIIASSHVLRPVRLVSGGFTRDNAAVDASGNHFHLYVILFKSVWEFACREYVLR